jgi:RND family efflux transporter MFP subunit
MRIERSTRFSATAIADCSRTIAFPSSFLSRETAIGEGPLEPGHGLACATPSLGVDEMNPGLAGRYSVLVNLCFLLVLGCDHSQVDLTQQVPPATVIVSPPVEQSVVDYVDYTGRTDSADAVEIRSRVTGFLQGVYFKDGAEVKKNALLYQIDDREFQASLAAALAEIAAARARQNRANADFNRTKTLHEKRVATAEMYDQAQAAKIEADAAVLAAEAKRDRAQLDVEFSKIAAPMAGKISRNNTSVGNLVNANMTVLTTIVSVDPMYVYFDVDEATLLKIRRQVREGALPERGTQPVTVLMGLAGDKGYPHQGTLDFVENKVNPNTGTIRVRGTFPNPRPARGARILESGMFARIRVPIGNPQRALLVAERAIGTDQGQKFLYVVNQKNEVVFRPIQLGALHDGLRVIAEWLKPDEQIIIDGLQRVRPGSAVTPKPGAMRQRAGEAIAEVSAKDAAPADNSQSSKAPAEH